MVAAVSRLVGASEQHVQTQLRHALGDYDLTECTIHKFSRTMNTVLV